MKYFEKPDDKSILSDLAAITRTDKGRCWAPGLECMQKPIRAHTVQNSRILERLQENGAVSKIELKLLNGETHVKFENVGRKKATTFYGLCAKHDASIFEKLDLESLDNLSTDQKALLTWRAITHEMSEKLAMTLNFQEKYSERIEGGLVDKEVFDPYGMEAMAWGSVLYDFFNYREKHVTPLISNTPKTTGMVFKQFRILQTGPRIAASAFFVLDELEKTHLTINIFPNQNDTVVLFSVARTDVRKVMPRLRALKSRRGINTVSLSSLILSRLHNFVLSPSIVAAWSDEKRTAIEEAFASTITNYNFVGNLELIDLFSD